MGDLGRKDLLEKEMANHSSALARKIPWAEEPGRLQFMGSQSDTTERLHFHFQKDGLHTDGQVAYEEMLSIASY